MPVHAAPDGGADNAHGENGPDAYEHATGQYDGGMGRVMARYDGAHL